MLQPGREKGDEQSQSGGTENGEIQFVVEMKLDDIVDWIWEELQAPEPQAQAHRDHGRARLRARRLGPARRALAPRPAPHHERGGQAPGDPGKTRSPFTNDDLRFRQLVKRAQPAMNAAVIFALDVSGSMDEAQRKLAKTFFFFALQGIRRQYSKVDTVFVAHAARPGSSTRAEFFQASSSGGTVSSAPSSSRSTW